MWLHLHAHTYKEQLIFIRLNNKGIATLNQNLTWSSLSPKRPPKSAIIAVKPGSTKKRKCSSRSFLPHVAPPPYLGIHPPPPPSPLYQLKLEKTTTSCSTTTLFNMKMKTCFGEYNKEGVAQFTFFYINTIPEAAARWRQTPGADGCDVIRGFFDLSALMSVSFRYDRVQQHCGDFFFLPIKDQANKQTKHLFVAQSAKKKSASTDDLEFQCRLLTEIS